VLVHVLPVHVPTAALPVSAALISFESIVLTATHRFAARQDVAPKKGLVVPFGHRTEVRRRPAGSRRPAFAVPGLGPGKIDCVVVMKRARNLLAGYPELAAVPRSIPRWAARIVRRVPSTRSV